MENQLSIPALDVNLYVLNIQSLSIDRLKDDI